MPRRPRYSARRRLRASDWTPCRYWASRTAASSAGTGTTAARSTTVRRSVVTGIRSLTVVSIANAVARNAVARPCVAWSTWASRSRRVEMRWRAISPRVLPPIDGSGPLRTTDEHGCHQSPLSGSCRCDPPRTRPGWSRCRQPVTYAAGRSPPVRNSKVEELRGGPPRRAAVPRVQRLPSLPAEPAFVRAGDVQTQARRALDDGAPRGVTGGARLVDDLGRLCARTPGVLALISTGPGCARPRPRRWPPRPRGSRRPRGRSTARGRRRAPRPRGCRWRRPGRWPGARRRAASR